MGSNQKPPHHIIWGEKTVNHFILYPIIPKHSIYMCYSPVDRWVSGCISGSVLVPEADVVGSGGTCAEKRIRAEQIK